MNNLIKQTLIICLIISSAIATTNNYICTELSMNDDGSWNVERPNVSDANVTNLTLSAKCGPDINIESIDPAKAVFSDIKGEMTASFCKNGEQMVETVNHDDFTVTA